MASTIQADINAARVALGEWWAAIASSSENPVVLLGERRGQPRTRTQQVFGAVGWSGLLLLLLWAGHLAELHYFPQLSAQYSSALALVLAVAGCLLVWISFGLFDAAVFTLKLISAPRTVGRGEIEFDESLHASRLSDREITVGMALLVLPRLVSRWALAPLLAMTLLVLWQLRGFGAETGSVTLIGMILHEHFSARALISFLPLSVALICLTGLLAAIALVLWLITLGRGVRLDWQVNMLAASVTLVQLAWIPIALSRMLAPPAQLTMSRVTVQHGSAGPILAFLAVPAFLAGTLHFARKRPFFRLSAAVLLPPLGLAVWCLLPHPVADMNVTLASATSEWMDEQLRYFGALALVNPLTLSYPQLLGLDASASYYYTMFGWYRLPLLVLLQLVCIAICAHAARLAVRDWRTAED